MTRTHLSNTPVASRWRLSSLTAALLAALALPVSAEQAHADHAQAEQTQSQADDKSAAAATTAPDGAEDGRVEARVDVIGSPLLLQRLPGAGTLIGQEEFVEQRPVSINDILNKVPGLTVREEEGFGLRPNIGIRGLNPTRSSKVLLLEDGLPLTYAPYGDNATYFHPTVERFVGAEVLKGSAQVAFGPHSVGGVINYLTPNTPEDTHFRLALAGGGNAYGKRYIESGDNFGGFGVLLQIADREADGSRDNMHFEQQDYNLKLQGELGLDQSFTVKASRYAEDSQVSYSGLTLAEYQADSRQNPFSHDTFDATRDALALTHKWQFMDRASLTTSVYETDFSRDWWRQSSNSGQRPNDPNCGGMANIDTTCGTEGRLRNYQTEGLESRLRWELGSERFGQQLEAGFRFHNEDQHRIQAVGATPDARSVSTERNSNCSALHNGANYANGGVCEDSVRAVEARTVFVQDTFRLGDFSLTPGLRREWIDYSLENRMLASANAGDSSVQETVWGVGANYAVHEQLAVFAGVHEGFSPPTVTDLICSSNSGCSDASTGELKSVELDAERSINSELGMRYYNDQWQIEAAWFRLDFDNQIVKASLAGGAGSDLANGGATLHEGWEGGVQFASNKRFEHSALSWQARASFTWLETADYRGTRFSGLRDFSTVDISDNRLAYTPEWTYTLGFGVDTAYGVEVMIDTQFVGEQFSDDLNTEVVQDVTVNGRYYQQGEIDDHRLYNLTANWALANTGFTFFLSGKNLTNENYVVDMSRGLIPGMPRQWILGLEWQY